MGKPDISGSEIRKALYEGYNESGLTVDEYCSRHGIEKNKLQYAIRIHRWNKSKPNSNPTGVNSFKEIPISFVGNSELTVILRNGLQVRIPQNPHDAQSLVKVIGALELC